VVKVRIVVMVNIDPEAWTMNYGVEGAAEIRADVVAYVGSLVREQLNDVGVLDLKATITS
jgi:hypothetical protein